MFVRLHWGAATPVSILLFACGGMADDDSEQALPEAAQPVAGVSKLVVLPHGDTVTVPVAYSFKQQPGIDSLIGTLLDGTGSVVFEYDACGQAGERINREIGTRDQAVNAEFFHGRHRESWPGLLVTYPDRGPCNFIFEAHISDEQALTLARTYTALDEPQDSLCYFSER
jgi:hypothetical protein